jgi:hypothetical protein
VIVCEDQVSTRRLSPSTFPSSWLLAFSAASQSPSSSDDRGPLKGGLLCLEQGGLVALDATISVALVALDSTITEVNRIVAIVDNCHRIVATADN